MSKFEQVGSKEITESEDSIISIMSAVFKQQPATWFTQKDFVTNLNKSNPFVNKTLHKLMEQDKIERVKSGNKFYYRAKMPKASKKAQ